MNLSKEQLEQCRKEFEDLVKSRGYSLIDPVDRERVHEMRCAWQAAWHPVPTVEELLTIAAPLIYADDEGPVCGVEDAMKAIHRAFGGRS